jgi:hypothetical protein
VENPRHDYRRRIDAVLNHVGARAERHDQLANSRLRTGSAALGKLVEGLDSGIQRVMRPQSGDRILVCEEVDKPR